MSAGNVYVCVTVPLGAAKLRAGPVRVPNSTLHSLLRLRLSEPLLVPLAAGHATAWVEV